MMSQEKLLLRERLGNILPDWNITDNLEATCNIKHKNITESQTSQIASLGLFVSCVYLNPKGLVIVFSGRIS